MKKLNRLAGNVGTILVGWPRDPETGTARRPSGPELRVACSETGGAMTQNFRLVQV